MCIHTQNDHMRTLKIFSVIRVELRWVMEREGLEKRQSSLKGLRERAIVNQTNFGTLLKATLGKLLRDGDGTHMGFSERLDTTLN